MISSLKRLLTSLPLVLVAAQAFAGPQDVRLAPEDVEPQLKPYQKLELPASPQAQAAPLPEPPAPDVDLAQGQAFAISDSRSLLASYGNLSPKEAGFRADVWRYMNASEALTLLAAQQPSAIRYLNERRAQLFRLNADAPDGAEWSFFAARLEALGAIGHQDEIKPLLEALPESLSSELAVDQLFTLLAPRLGAQAACDSIADRPAPKQADAASWQRIELFCDAAAGQFATVELAQSMGEERGAPLASWFVSLVEHMQYQVGNLPQLPPEAAISDHAMLASLGALADAKKTEQAEEKPYPKQPAYALMAISKLVRQSAWNETGDWLKMLDKQNSQSAASFVAHELVRFLKSDLHQPRSEAANSLPAFTATQDASAADKQLLMRFYGLMERFGYSVPPVTQEWLSLQPKPDWKTHEASILAQASKAGNVAGYLLQLDEWLRTQPLKTLSNDTIGSRLDELLYLREEELARRLAAEAVLQSLN